MYYFLSGLSLRMMLGTGEKLPCCNVILLGFPVRTRTNCVFHRYHRSYC